MLSSSSGTPTLILSETHDKNCKRIRHYETEENEKGGKSKGMVKISLFSATCKLVFAPFALFVASHTAFFGPMATRVLIRTAFNFSHVRNKIQFHEFRRLGLLPV